MTNRSAAADKDVKGAPFVVLGIALIVDEIGHGAHMALRYPTAPQVDNINQQEVNDDFFRLTPRQMAKLFRPKPPLCGQAMTLSVGGTLFCCYATLLPSENDPDYHDASYAVAMDPTDGSSDANHLSLFSLIVALAPRVRASTIPITGWATAQEKNTRSSQQQRTEGGTAKNADDSAGHLAETADPESLSDQQERQYYHRSLSGIQGKLSMPKAHESEASPSFVCIRRVHVALARMSRVLLREERRCRYVSLQCQLYKQIRSSVHKARQQSAVNKKIAAQSSSAQTNVTSSPAASTATKSVVTQPQQAATEGAVNSSKRSHRRNSSWTLEREVNERPPPQETERHANENAAIKTDPVEDEREALEAILALSLYDPEEHSLDDSALSDEEESTKSGIPAKNDLSRLQERGHCGNLAQELVAFYHGLARDKEHQSPLDLLGGEGIIYVNRHIALAVEAISSNTTYESTKVALRPHHTMLFPKASPTELLVTMRSAAPRLHQLLSSVNPQKTMKEIAVDANLPLQIAMELATYLIGQGVCFASPVVTRQTVLCCSSIDDVHKYALEFVQKFGAFVNLFLLVSFLTSGNSLGESMNLLTTSPENNALYLRRQMEDMLSSAPIRTARRHRQFAGSNDESTAEELEEMLYSLAVWLLSRNVIVHLHEFLIAIDTGHRMPAANVSDQSEKKCESASRSDGLPDDDALFQELKEIGCLKGTISVQSCCWRVQMDYQRLKSFALRHESIRIVSRAPVATDDW